MVSRIRCAGALNFRTATLLWLGLTTWLNGERRKPVVSLSSAGMLAAALFFLCHTMILGRGLVTTDSGMDFWWRLAWIPLAVAPYVWLLLVLRYAGLTPTQIALYRRWQIALGVGCVLLVPVFLIGNPFPTYASLVYARVIESDWKLWFAGVPVMLWLFLPYAVLCFLVPLVALLSPPAEQSAHNPARPWLAAVSFTLMSVGWLSSPSWFGLRASMGRWQPSPTRNAPYSFWPTWLYRLWSPWLLFYWDEPSSDLKCSPNVLCPDADSFASGGAPSSSSPRSPLAVAFVYRIQLRPIYSLMLATALAATMFALVSWRIFAEHEEFLTLLRPFVASTHLRERLLSGREGSGDIHALFEALCRDVLDAQYAGLILDSANGSAPQRIGYRWSEGAKSSTH